MAYRLGKRVISQFIRTGCRRRLRLDLYRGIRDREAARAPEKDANRPGLALLTRQGKEYEREKFLELESIFPDLVVRGALKDFDAAEDRAFDAIDLADHIANLAVNQLVLEAQFEITPSFKEAHHLGDLEDGSAVGDGQPLSFERLRPDIIRVCSPAGTIRRVVTPSGHLERIGITDQRLGLQIIDIKIAAEPSPAHFSELAYYGMGLAGWLEDNGYADRYVVLADAAIWPGAHDGSTMHRLQREDRLNNVPVLEFERYQAGLQADLEDMPPEVVLGRIQRFLAFDLREVLAEADWQQLDWHIDHRCSGCDYLGYRWSRHDDEAAEGDPTAGENPNPLYCWPMAEQSEHLSRVAGLTEGACGKLREAEVRTVSAVSILTAGNAVFERHQTLRAKRTVLQARAATLQNAMPAAIPSRAGTSAILPRFADIRVAVSVDFDIGSGLTFAFGYRIDYGVPNAERPNGPDGPRFGRIFSTIERPLLVLERSVQAEGEMLRVWLTYLVGDVFRVRQEILDGYRANGAPDKSDVTLQFFLWDRLVFDHLCRVLGRHLDLVQAPVQVGNMSISPMAWIFPSEGVLEEPDFVSRSSPITIVSDTVSSIMAAPIPHHYGLIDLANSIDPEERRLPNGDLWWFHVNKFYRDPLSDLIPSERGHEVWEQASPFGDKDFQWHQEELRKVVRRKLHAVSYIVRKLTGLLADQLSAEAPGVTNVFQPSTRLTGVGDDGQILYQHTRLMAAAQQLEIDLLMAMPPHEREARFRSARVEAILSGEDRQRGLQRLGLNHRLNDNEVLVFRLSDRSREARLKEGEFTWSFLPETDFPTLQYLTVAQFKERNLALAGRKPVQPWDYRDRLREALKVTILKINRAERLLAVQASDLLHESLRLDLLHTDIDGTAGRFGIIDPVAMDVFTRKFRKTLEDQSGVRNPPIARQRPLFPSLAIARVRPGQPRGGQVNGPTAEFIWNADVMALAANNHDPQPIIANAERVAPGLTGRQRDAIQQAITRRLSLWWGPPGTGKSRTAQAYIVGICSQALTENRALRVAVVGFTWVAIDNVTRRLPELLEREGITERVHLARLSSSDSLSGIDPLLHDHVTSMDTDHVLHPRRVELDRRLAQADGVTVVASTVDQLHKLGLPSVCAPLFDVMLIDEASQLDVAHAIVGLSKLATEGQVVVIGDDKQMAPIHPLEAPDGTEHLVGSIYDFYRNYREHENQNLAIEPVMLNRSFRSNREIVEFVREAGYGEDLEASPGNANLRISTVTPLPTAEPTDWPDELRWSSGLAPILEATEPLVAVVHKDRFSSQRNDDEADLTASLVLSLFRAGLHRLNHNDETLSPNDFFSEGLGIVTPHRAQQAAVFDRLAAVFPPEVDRNVLFSSIDTVERFQGQEKAVILASFGLGDVDQIAAEEQFLFSLNRFNVAASRAQAKFVAIVSRSLVDHLPSDRRVLEESRLLKHFVDGFLTRTVRIDLPGLGPCDLKLR